MAKVQESKLKIALFCGGQGTRMWPMSRKDKPKQFQPLIGKETTFQMMVKRLKKGFSASDIFPVTIREYVGSVVQQAPEIPLENIIIEPEGRDTLAAVGLSVTVLDKKFDNPVVLGVWSDHLIRNDDEFIKAINVAYRLACEHKKPVEIAVRPVFPSTQLGYLQIGKMISRIDGLAVSEFIRHVEKPSFAKAKGFITSWEYLWHIGYSVWPAQILLSLFEQNVRETFRILMLIKKIWGKAGIEGRVGNLYKKIPRSSIDFAILEKLKPNDQLVVSADLGWSDIGAWDILKDELAESQESNVIKGKVIDFGSQNCLIYSHDNGKIVATLGLFDLIVVDTPDALLICPKEKAQEVKKIIERLKEKNREEFL
jgi:mannose-1-phosphate guanylyltransferase